MPDSFLIYVCFYVSLNGKYSNKATVCNLRLMCRNKWKSLCQCSHIFVVYIKPHCIQTVTLVSVFPAPIMENHETLMNDSSADGVARVKGNIITTVTPERKAEEENGEQVDSQTDMADNPDPAASTPLKQETKVTQQVHWRQNKCCKIFHQTASLKLLQQFFFTPHLRF